MISLFLAFLSVEVIARLLTSVDVDGNVTIGSRMIRPFRPPVRQIQEKIEQFQARVRPQVGYHPDLGWVPQPNTRSRNGMYIYNSSAVRSGDPVVEYSLRPESDVQRIALFGDSFTHGDEVFFEHSWGARLGETLRENRAVEVMNFGVGGYGMGQAYLRWQIDGRRFVPSTVIFGFQAENMQRNVNIVRPFYYKGTGLPFSKPRFIIQNDELLNVNQPAIPPTNLVETIKDFESWDLRKYEHYISENDYRPRLWSSSRFLSVVADAASRYFNRPDPAPNFFRMDAEPARLSLEIIAAFAEEVEATGATFLIVHLPKRGDLRRLEAGRPLAYAEFLEELQKRYRVVDTANRLLRSAGSIEELFVKPRMRHYTPVGNRAVAEALAAEIRAGT